MFCNTCRRDEDKAYKLLTFMIELHKKTQLFLLKSNSCEVSVVFHSMSWVQSKWGEEGAWGRTWAGLMSCVPG